MNYYYVGHLRQDIEDFGIMDDRTTGFDSRVRFVRAYLTGTVERDNNKFSGVDERLKGIFNKEQVNSNNLPSEILKVLEKTDLKDKAKVKLHLNYIFCSILEKDSLGMSIRDAVKFCCGLAKKISEEHGYKPEDIFGGLGEKTKGVFEDNKFGLTKNFLQTYSNMVREGFEQEHNLNQIFQTHNVRNSVSGVVVSSPKSFFKSIKKFFTGLKNKFRKLFKRDRVRERLDNKGRDAVVISGNADQVSLNGESKFRQNIKAAPGISQVVNGAIPKSITPLGRNNPDL